MNQGGANINEFLKRVLGNKKVNPTSSINHQPTTPKPQTRIAWNEHDNSRIQLSTTQFRPNSTVRHTIETGKYNKYISLPVVVSNPDGEIQVANPIEDLQQVFKKQFKYAKEFTVNKYITGQRHTALKELKIDTKVIGLVAQIPIPIPNPNPSERAETLHNEYVAANTKYLLVFKDDQSNSTSTVISYVPIITIPFNTFIFPHQFVALYENNEFKIYVEENLSGSVNHETLTVTLNVVNSDTNVNILKVILNSQQLYSFELGTRNDMTDLRMINRLIGLPKSTAEGGKAKEYITILSKIRLVVKRGRCKYVRVKGELMKISEAKALEKLKKSKKNSGQALRNSAIES